MASDSETDAIAAVRRFSRFYTRSLGLIGEGLLGSPYSMAEARVIYEIANREQASARDLIRDLGLDAGYLSRILKRLEEQGIVARTADPADARSSRLALTFSGREAFGRLDEASRAQVGALLAPLGPSDRARLVGALATVEALLGPATDAGEIVVRRHQPGDMGAVISGHARLYHEEYGWDVTFEALVAEIAAKFITTHDPERERAFIAECRGEVVGSAFIVRDTDETAKLRLVYVERRMRGTGLGKRLVREAIQFARAAGYRRLTLWTNDILHAARRIYETEGFRLVSEEQHTSFGKDLVGQYWELDL